MLNKILAPIMERKGQQTTKFGLLSLVAGLGVFPENINFDMVFSLANDWVDVTVELYNMVGYKGAAAAILLAVAARMIGVNRDRV